MKITLSKFVEAQTKDDILMFGEFYLPDYVLVRSISSDGTIEIQTRFLTEHGKELLSEKRTVLQHQLLPLALAHDIRELNKSIHKLAAIMGDETFVLFQLQHRTDELKALGIFDDKLVSAMIKAWFLDGGFVEALRHLGFEQEFDSNTLRMLDAPFDPKSGKYGYEVKPVKTVFSLEKPKDIQKLIALINKSQTAVIEARDGVKKFIAEHFSIEEIL
jgi:hypothetical protein